jgi:hypothetical protein
MELEQQLGGLFSLLTVEFLIPYLNRTLHILQRNRELPKIPKDLVRPEIIAGVNALGRGQDQQSLVQFAQTLAQTMGPEIMGKFLEPGEYVKRLAAAQGIDVLNLVKTPETMAQERQQQQQQMMQAEMMKQAGQFANSPMMDPSKNEAAGELLKEQKDRLTNGNNQGEPPSQGAEETPPQGQ